MLFQALNEGPDLVSIIVVNEVSVGWHFLEMFSLKKILRGRETKGRGVLRVLVVY